MLNIAITFDYELFLGENYYDSSKVLFEPTDKILEILKQNKEMATFFVDVCSVMQHKKYGLDDYVNGFSEQIRKMDRYGSEVELHIHPNWLKSVYENENWIFDQESYRIHYFDEKKEDAWSMGKIIEEGIAYLNDTLLPVNPDYRCIAYRAGGFAIQPHPHLFKELCRNGIRVDSSVVVNDYSDCGVASYDFRNVSSPLNWKVAVLQQAEIACEAKENEVGLWEIPVMTMKNSIIHRLLIPKRKRGFSSAEPMGKPISINSGVKHTGKLERLMKYNHTYRRLSMDAMNYEYLLKQLETIYKTYGAEQKDIYIAIIGHPKAFSGEAFENLDKLIKGIKERKTTMKIVGMKSFCSAMEGNNR